MESVKAKVSPLIPFLFLGYLETLRMAVFHAFEWGNSIQYFITALIVVVYSVNFQSKAPHKAKTVCGLIILLFTLFSGIISKDTDSDWIIATGLNAAYGLIVFMTARFIIERSSAREILLLGGGLLAVIAITSDEAMRPLIFINFTFGVGLVSQLHLLSLENDPRVRFTNGTGIKSSIWGSVFLLTVIFISVINVIFSVEVSKAAATSSMLNFFGSTSQQQENRFWDKLQKFEFNGTVPLEETVVMWVQSPRPSYWRGESLDYYTGRGWTNTMSVRPIRDDDLRITFPPDIPVSKVAQKFAFSPGIRSQVIYSGGRPAEINFSSNFKALSDRNMLTDNGGNLYIPQRLSGISYEVVSYFADFNKVQSGQLTDNYHGEAEATYLQLPDVPERVRSLAVQVAQSAKNPYEKAKKIEHYLSTSYPYDLTVKPAPPNRDITDYFLFELKKGYCTYHSTAMVVMLRSVGIPARWVTGFTTGKYNVKKGAYEVKMSNAHAWVEAYITGFGWVPFEPTSSFTIPPVPEKNINVGVNDVKQTKLPDGVRQDLKVNQRNILIKTAIFALAIILLTTVIIIRPKALVIRNSENMEQVYKLFLQLLACKGHYKNAVQTPHEFAEQLVRMEDFREDHLDIMYITESYVFQRFGRGKIDEVRLTEALIVLKRLACKWRIKTRD